MRLLDCSTDSWAVLVSVVAVAATVCVDVVVVVVVDCWQFLPISVVVCQMSEYYSIFVSKS